MNLERLTEISKEIGAWAEQNFKIHNPPLGILEEIGECSHCVLKQSQGIRGFENPEHFKAEFLDALCDLCIYTLHSVALGNIKLHRTTTGYGSKTDELFLAHLAGVAGCILLGLHTDDYGDEPHSVVFSIAEHYATFRGFDLWPALEETWSKVKARDWKADPLSGVKIENCRIEVSPLPIIL